MNDSQVYLPADTVAARASAMAEFARHCGTLADADLQEWPALQEWTLAQPSRFWRAFIDWAGIDLQGEWEPAISSDDCETAKFFPNARLNYARELLRAREAAWNERIAITETRRSSS